MGSLISQIQRKECLLSENLKFISVSKYLKLCSILKNSCESFSLCMDEFSHVFEDERSFMAWDIHGTGLIETLEVLTGILVLAKAEREDKLHLLFKLFDLNNENSISTTDLKLLCFTTLSSVLKIHNRPETLDFQEIAKLVDYRFESSINYQQFREFCDQTPEISTFLSVFEDPKA